MNSPRTITEVQALNGKLAALGRFLSKSAEKAMPFYKTLKGCLAKKDFLWSEEAELAFQKLKTYIGNLPALASPIPGETLTLYLSATKEAISASLVTDRTSVQIPIYFVIRALQGAEISYPAVEKVVLALVYAARRLRRYFQAHTIAVLTNAHTKNRTD